MNEFLASKSKRIPQEIPADGLREEYIDVIASDFLSSGVEEYAGVRAILKALLKESSQDLSNKTAQYIPGDPQSRGERLLYLAKLVAVATSIIQWKNSVYGDITKFRSKHAEALRVHAEEQLHTQKELDSLRKAVDGQN